jgi:hypothetical protein
MILYTEKQLEDCYRQYCLLQGKNNMSFVSLKEFRILFEDLTEIIYKEKE